METKESLQPSQVMIAGRLYPVKIRDAEKEKMQQAVALISEKLSEYQRIYSGKDAQDYLAMCALTLAFEQVSIKNEISLKGAAEQKHLAEINSILDETLGILLHH
ncbi:MAG: cell division protein ZapA [Chitinophagales bacterium]|nr:cell division protein ZapA [Chitinophagales bacterium]